MSFLKGKNCQLRLLLESDLPLLLEWRNKKHVLMNMEYQHVISKEEHIRWYQMILQEKYHYFIIETLENEPVGTIYLSGKTIDNGAESGLYIGDERFLGTGITLEASQLLIDYAFNEIKLNYLFAKVKSSNSAIIAYNERIGFKIEKELNPGFLKMRLNNRKN